MIPNSVVYPYNFVNRRGIPLIESAGIEATDTQVTITITNRAFRFLDDRGIFLFRLNQAIPEGSEALPVVFSWTGFMQSFTQPLTLVGGTAATGEQLTGAGVYVIYFDKAANILQLVSVGIAEAAAATTTVSTTSINSSTKSK